MKYWLALVLFLGCALSAAAQTAKPMLPGSVLIEDCSIVPDEQAEISAQEAGVLTAIPTKDGGNVKKNDVIVQIDDVIPKMQIEVAVAKMAAAKEEAENQTSINYAKKTLKTRLGHLQRAEAANRETVGAIPEQEVEERKLAVEEAKAMVEKATKDLSVAEKQMAVAEAEVRAAQTQCEHRKIKSPIDGVIRNVKKHIGEWAQQGDPIFNVVRMDRLRVQGSLKADQCSPEEVIGKTVIVEAVAERGRKITAQGKIVYVDPVLEGGSYAVRAEVENYQEKSGFWAIRPGMDANVTVRLK